jgi:hypothetical protein
LFNFSPGDKIGPARGQWFSLCTHSKTENKTNVFWMDGRKPQLRYLTWNVVWWTCIKIALN